MSLIKQRIKEILNNLSAKIEADIKSGKMKLRVPVKDYINKDGTRVREYESKIQNRTDS
jgi:hypothetical protein